MVIFHSYVSLPEGIYTQQNPYEPCLISWHQARKCLRRAYAIASALFTRTRVLLTRISCLTLACGLQIFAPHPYKRPFLPKHERKGLERGSFGRASQ